MIIIRSISESVYQQTQQQYKEANLLQTAEMGTLQTSRGRAIDYLAFYDDEVLIGQTIVQYRKVKRFFTEALLLHGPLLLDWKKDILTNCLKALEQYLQKKGCASVSLSPYLVQTRKDEQLTILQDQLAKEPLQTFSHLGYKNSFDPHQETLVNTLFVKPLSSLHSQEELLQSLTPSVKRNIKKFQASHIKVEELAPNALDQFYDILTTTSQRRDFFIQDFDYFQKLKKSFQEQAKFMYAYLDCPAYITYLEDNIQHFSQRIKEIEEQAKIPLSKGTKGKINDAKDQLQSYQKRLQQFEEMHITTDKLPLSSYLFICYGHEVVSFAGGNYEQYIHFGGATLIHWQMMQYAQEHGFSNFNFYGTSETNLVTTGKGNFKFKSQFGGELQLLVGTFSKYLGLSGQILSLLSS